jgi:hypothetical protein
MAQFKLDLHHEYRRPPEPGDDLKKVRSLRRLYRGRIREGSKWSWAFALTVALLFALGYGLGYLLVRALQFAAWTRGYSLGYAAARALPAAFWSRWMRLFIWC